MKIISMTLFLGCLFCLSTLTLGQESSVTVRVSDDFSIIRDPHKKLMATIDPADLKACRENISKVICWSEPRKPGQVGPRPCLAGGEKFAASFEGHFDRSPDLIKKMYCYVSKITVEQSFFGTAYANGIVDANDKLTSGEVGIRQEVLESPLSFDDWLSWKEETTFGGSPLTTAPRLGIIKYQSNHATTEFFLDYVLDHEFGHLFDFANHLNQTTKCEYKETTPGNWEQVGECKPLPGTWADLFWQSLVQPKPDDDYPFRKDVCFYHCNGKSLDRDKASTIFASLMKTQFQSTYAGTHPVEDFAETFAMYLAHTEFGLQYSITAQAQIFDMTAHFNSNNLAKKRDYVQSFLKGSFIYPGEEPHQAK
jgi:hypothetical protein